MNANPACLFTLTPSQLWFGLALAFVNGVWVGGAFVAVIMLR